MPVIIVYGVLEGFDKGKLLKLCSNMCGFVSGKLNLDGKGVSAFFPRDHLKDGLGEEIIIFVKGFFDKPERTSEIRKEMADVLVKMVSGYFPEALVECFVEVFNPENGFSSNQS